MIARKTLEELAQVLEPARDQMEWKCPHIQMVSVGQYRVSGSKKPYEVICGRTEDGLLFVACGCMANLHGKHCYHALRAFLSHVQIKTLQKGK